MKICLSLLSMAAGLLLLISFREKPATVSPLVVKTSPSSETVVVNGLQTRKFIPPKMPGSGGDNDFFGHGPTVKIKVEIFIKTKAFLYARVTMTAAEVGGDGTTASGSREELLYFAGWGNEILSINSPVETTVAYTDDNHNEDYVGGNGRVRAHEAAAFWNENPSFVRSTDLVRFCVVTGDEDGGEVGTRTGVRVFFNPITLTLKNPAPSPTANFSLNATGSGGCGENTCSASCGSGLLQFYGFSTVSCEQFWNRERSVSHFVNWTRDAGIANMGMPPNVLRDKLKDWKSDVQLRNLSTSNYSSEIQKIIRDQHRPVIALVAWGSRAVKDYYVPNDDSYGIGNAILHYVIIDGWDKGSTGKQFVWHVIDNGVHRNWTNEYFQNAFFWRPENFVIEGLLYPQDVHPGNIVY
jgi:hypothetical protein